MKREKYLVRRGLMLQGILIIVSLIFLLSMSGWWAFAFSVAFIAGVYLYGAAVPGARDCELCAVFVLAGRPGQYSGFGG